MPSFDIVNELNLQEVDNAVNQTKKEIAGRFDFKSGKTDLELDKTAKTIKVTADDEFKLRSLHQILEQKLITRKVDLKVVEYGDSKPAPGQVLIQTITLKEGIDKEEAKKIVKLIKDSELKVQASIQDEQVRVTAKKIDDLQAVIQMLRSSPVKVPLQFVNMRS